MPFQLSNIKVFPTKELNFKLISSQQETLDRLNRRTEWSQNLTSQPTDKSFRGMIEGNKFKLISSKIGRGAFCVLTGKIDSDKGTVNVKIHKAFKIILSFMFCMPILGIVISIITERQEPDPSLIPMLIVFVLLIRFVFIELTFRFQSKESLNRLRDVLDIEWIQN